MNKTSYQPAWLVILMCLMMASGGAVADSSQEVLQEVKASTAKLIDKLQEEKDIYHSNPNRFYQIMEEEMTDVVDFRRIAARVMGRYRRAANDTQKDQFVEIFKKSLFNAYGKTLVESGKFTVHVLAAHINARDSERASVDLEVVSSSGNKYPVQYSMYKNADRQIWLLENVIVNGVNIGLAFRDRFEQQYAEHNGDLDKLIANWSSAIDEDVIEEGG